jgi:AraC-like DNA-binding protein
MSYDYRLLFEGISLSLCRNPCHSLEVLSRELRISRRTIQNVIITMTGKNLRALRKEILITRVRSLFIASPSSAIKEVSFDLGYKSARSFARAIRRTCGASPRQFRSRITDGLTTHATGAPSSM